MSLFGRRQQRTDLSDEPVGSLSNEDNDTEDNNNDAEVNDAQVKVGFH